MFYAKRRLSLDTLGLRLGADARSMPRLTQGARVELISPLTGTMCSMLAQAPLGMAIIDRRYLILSL